MCDHVERSGRRPETLFLPIMGSLGVHESASANCPIWLRDETLSLSDQRRASTLTCPTFGLRSSFRSRSTSAPSPGSLCRAQALLVSLVSHVPLFPPWLEGRARPASRCLRRPLHLALPPCAQLDFVCQFARSAVGQLSLGQHEGSHLVRSRPFLFVKLARELAAYSSGDASRITLSPLAPGPILATRLVPQGFISS